MKEIDKRNRLEEQPFSYRISKDDKVVIFWYEKQATILKGEACRKFMERMKRAMADINADTDTVQLEMQLIMAKATGNFKHGNEKGMTRKGAW